MGELYQDLQSKWTPEEMLSQGYIVSENSFQIYICSKIIYPLFMPSLCRTFIQARSHIFKCFLSTRIGQQIIMNWCSFSDLYFFRMAFSDNCTDRRSSWKINSTKPVQSHKVTISILRRRHEWGERGAWVWTLQETLQTCGTLLWKGLQLQVFWRKNLLHVYDSQVLPWWSRANTQLGQEEGGGSGMFEVQRKVLNLI